MSKLLRAAALVLIASFLSAASARALTAPTVTGTALGISSITWNWTSTPGAAGYRVLSSTNPGANISGDLPSAASAFTLTGLSANTSGAIQVEAFGAGFVVDAATSTRYTLAAPTTALALLGLSSTTAVNGGETERLSWGANGNPAGTSYNVLWWTNLTSTVTVSTGAAPALIGNLFAGSTLYFTVQAQNRDGIPTAFDSTFYTLGPSTASFAVASQVLPVGFAGGLTFVVPSGDGAGAGIVGVQIASGTFASPVTFTVSTFSAVPAVEGGVSDLPNPIHLTIAAFDAFGSPQQPQHPVMITATYAAANLAANQTTLDISRYDALRGVWIPLATSKRGSTLSALTDHLSSFAVLSVGAASNLSSITVGPNPLRPILNPGAIMTFRNLPAGCRVRIFSYVGEKLIDLIADGSGTVGWDGRNRAGASVASGVYIALIEGAGTKRTMRVAIER